MRPCWRKPPIEMFIDARFLGHLSKGFFFSLSMCVGLHFKSCFMGSPRQRLALRFRLATEYASTSTAKSSSKMFFRIDCPPSAPLLKARVNGSNFPMGIIAKPGASAPSGPAHVRVSARAPTGAAWKLIIFYSPLRNINIMCRLIRLSSCQPLQPAQRRRRVSGAISWDHLAR